jgi:hypothetical protein
LSPTPIEKPTIVERFVSLIPLPYPVASLIWSIMIPSGIVFYIVQYLVTGDSIPLTLALASPLNTLLNILLPFYLFLMVRYMRLRVVALKAPIARRLSGGELDYHQAFGKMTQTAPVLIMTIALGTVFLLLYWFAGVLRNGPAPTILTAIVIYLNVLAFQTYLWEFATAAYGLHKLGGSSLRLESFLEDRMMGVKSMGNLALSLTIAYFGGLLLTDLLLSTFLPGSTISTATFVAFLVLGVVLFFLPLNSIHAKMQVEKRRLMREISARYPRLNQDPPQANESTTLDDLRTGLARLTGLQELEMLDRKIVSLPTWPFDIQLIGKLITIILSIAAVLLSRIITNFLHI